MQPSVPQMLILYSTVYGQTKKICQYLSEQQLSTKYTIVQKSVVDCSVNDLEIADIIIIGASIRYGKHRPVIYDLVETHRELLATKKTVFFSVNLVARKPEKNTPATNPYMLTFLEQTAWQPTLVGVFAGQLDYARYGVLDKLMIKLIMWITKGPTHSVQPIEFTDWAIVKAFADDIFLLNT